MLRRRPLVFACAVAALGLLVSSASPGDASIGPHPFGTRFQTYLAGRESRVGAALLDLKTGQLWKWHPHQLFNAGSIVKVQIMGAVLHRAQVQNRTLTEWEKSNLVPMIEQSNNDAATRLWNRVGGTSGVGAFDQLAGLDHTHPAYHWGLT